MEMSDLKITSQGVSSGSSHPQPQGGCTGLAAAAVEAR